MPWSLTFFYIEPLFAAHKLKLTMKTTLLFLVLFFNFTNAQYKGGKIEYALTIGSDEKLEADQGFKAFLNFAKTGAKSVKFNLIFNNKESFFKKIDALENEYTSYAIAMSSADNIYFSNLLNDEIFYQVDNHLGKYIISQKDTIKWKITDETKQIDNYFCYKAVAQQTVINSKGVFKHPIIAWFCPSIPYGFGPKGYKGLPGLILELQVRHITWGATKIELLLEHPSIVQPSVGKKITQEEYNEIIKSSSFKM